jgi:hypothetical protein
MSDQVEAAIAVAQSKLGAPYVWATAGPDTFDCSGFTWWIACQVLGPQDYELRSSHHQFNVWGRAIRDEPIAGDLVFFDTMGVVVMGNRASHVGMMIDAARFIHAASEELGVRIDRLDAGWYAPRRIGTRRIFESTKHQAHADVPRRGRDPQVTGGYGALRLPAGPIRTPNPWNGASFGASWSNIRRWAAALEAAAAEHHLDTRLPAAVMALETQGIHERDGRVIEVWDQHLEDGPSVGLMQVKPWVWQYLVPSADAYDPASNIRLGTAVLAYVIGRYGSWVRAIAEGYHPGISPNGTTPARYVEAMRGLLGELGYAD